MSKHVRLKATFILAIVALCGAIGLYPFAAARTGLPLPQWFKSHSLKLGLDLRGGVHLVLGLKLPDTASTSERDAAVTQAIETIERRVNDLGVAEPIIARQGDRGDQILVQLPGVTDVEGAKEIIQSTGLLALQIVERGPAMSESALLEGAPLPESMEIARGDGPLSGDDVFYLLRRDASVAGRDIRTARSALDQDNRPAVSFTLKRDAGAKFGDLTARHIGRALAVVLDGRVRSVARIENRITTDGQILGSFTPQETERLAIVLRSGALSVPLTYLAQQTIGASLGADAVHSGVMASAAALILVLLFLLAYYRGAGVNAAIALACNLVVLIGLMAYLGVVLTLPGIAGFVLTMGIGVDSNVLIFERIKEELEAGRSPRAAVDTAFGRVFLTLLDTHVAALVSSACLFQFGTGPIRGFAVTLALGLISNLFTSTFVSRTLFALRPAGRGLSI